MDDTSVLSEIGSVFFDAIDFLLSGLKYFFVPRDDYFPRLADRIQELLAEKFGGVLGLSEYLSERFSNLQAYRGDLFVMTFPEGHMFAGQSLDVLSGADGISNLIRAAFSGFIVLCTAIFVVKRVIAMIES